MYEKSVYKKTTMNPIHEVFFAIFFQNVSKNGRFAKSRTKHEQNAKLSRTKCVSIREKALLLNTFSI